VRRFSANASKGAQATSRKKQLEKIKDRGGAALVAPESLHPFEQARKLYRSAVTVEKLCFTYPGSDQPVFKDLDLNIEAEERVAIIGPNGVGKTTLMRCLAGELRPSSGRIVWVENAQVGYMPQDPQAEFEEEDGPVLLDVALHRQGGRRPDRARDPRAPAVLGRGNQEIGEGAVGRRKGRMIYGKLMLTRPNVLLLDEPTNHMDMETIESLQIGLEKYPGTLIFVSHDREFGGRLATRIIEMKPGAASWTSAARTMST